MLTATNPVGLSMVFSPPGALSAQVRLKAAVIGDTEGTYRRFRGSTVRHKRFMASKTRTSPGGPSGKRKGRPPPPCVLSDSEEVRFCRIFGLAELRACPRICVPRVGLRAGTRCSRSRCFPSPPASWKRPDKPGFYDLRREL